MRPAANIRLRCVPCPVNKERERCGVPSQSNTEKGKDDSIEIKSPFLSKLDNFWYYHKWKVIIGIFLLVTFGVLIAQSIGKTEPDLMILIAGNDQVSVPEQQELAGVIAERYMPGDLNKVGESLMGMRFYSILSEEEAKRAETDGNVGITTLNVKNVTEYRDYLTTGDTAICILSEYWYLDLLSYERLQPLSGEGESAVFGVRLSDTALYREQEAADVLPGDWYVCLLKPYVFGNTGNKKTYAAMQQTVLAMVGVQDEKD